MGLTKASRVDDFPTLFFQHFWHIIRSDIISYNLGILNDDKNFDFANTIDIVLIPKIPSPTNLVNFRPISLCTVLYKIMENVVAN